MSFDKTLGELSQQLRRRDIRKGAPRRLEAAILSELPTSLAPSPSSLAPILVGSLAAIGCATAGLVGFSHYARNRVATRSIPGATYLTDAPLAQEKAKSLVAVGRQNTRHLSGTSRDSRSQSSAIAESKWEEWDRHSPFFHRADRSGETIIDDGTTLIHVIPPRFSMRNCGSARAVAIPGRIVMRRSRGQNYISISGTTLLAGPIDLSVMQPTYAASNNLAGGGGISGTVHEQLTVPVTTSPHGAGTELIEQQFVAMDDDKHPRTISVSRLLASRLSHLPSIYTYQNTPALAEMRRSVVESAVALAITVGMRTNIASER